MGVGRRWHPRWMVRQRQFRDERPLPDEATLVRSLFGVEPKGSGFDREDLIADATVNFRTFGYYGLSMWGITEAWPLDEVLAGKARRARRVALYVAGDLRAHGLEPVPSGRAPHFDATHQSAGLMHVTAPTASDLADRFLAAAYTVFDNHLFASDRPERKRQ